jgi:ABC-2 type transport system ATP-binding protein
MKVITVDRVTKRYGDLVAVDEVSFEVEEGEIFGLLGPNGAGKTTTVEMMEGLRVPDSGSIRILGLDPTKDGRKLKQRIGVQLQETSLYPDIKVEEALELFRSFYEEGLEVDDVLWMVALEGKRRSYYRNLSGGEKQRLAIALALINDPELLFLDELTTGLDPQGRRRMWELIEAISEEGRTIILTTHYMEEAERLCDRVGIIDHGKIIALDTPKKLIASLEAESKVELSSNDIDLQNLKGIKGVSKIESFKDGFILYTKDSAAVLAGLAELIRSEGWVIDDLHVRRPNLEDVFLALTGRVAFNNNSTPSGGLASYT